MQVGTKRVKIYDKIGALQFHSLEFVTTLEVREQVNVVQDHFIIGLQSELVHSFWLDQFPGGMPIWGGP